MSTDSDGDGKPDDAELLATIADELEAKGVAVDELRELSVELEHLEHPPGLFRREPTRPRDSHVLDQLRRQRELLANTGHPAQAERIDEILQHLEAEAELRELIRREAVLLTHWDRNRNGVWDEDELAAYTREVAEVRHLLVTHAARKRWFFELDGEVYGAARLSDLDDLRAASKSLLICFDGKTGWVALEHVLGDALPDPSRD